MDRVAEIRSRLEKSFSPEQLEIRDDSAQHSSHPGAKASGGGHFAVTIVSDKFNGLNMVQRHRAVYMAVEDMMPAEIHALSIRALAPGEN